MKGMWRCHHYVSIALQHGIEGRPAHCCAFLASLLLGIHQSALDQGDWSTGALLVPTEDPLTRAAFAAGEQEHAELYSCKKAVRDLKVRAMRPGREGDETVEEAGGEKQSGRRDRKRKK